MRVHNFKYRKIHKVKALKNSLDFKNVGLSLGVYGLRSLESKRLSDRQIESARRCLKKVIKKSGIIRARVVASLPVSKKPSETRMGKGKGAYSHSVCCVRAGTVLFELEGELISAKLAKEACLQAGKRLPCKTELFLYKS